MSVTNIIWAEKYRPKTIKDTILPKNLKEKFEGYVKSENVPSLLFIGKSGVGKSTVAKAMLEELNLEYIKFNGSSEGNIDTLRTSIQQFASTISLTMNKKYVIIDEADAMSSAMQMAFRDFTETFASNCGFILTCNYPNRILPELRSRFGEIHFSIPENEKPTLSTKMYTRCKSILKDNGISITEDTKNSIAALLKEYFPDFRKVITELEHRVRNNEIEKSIHSILEDENFNALVGYLKEKDFKNVRKWVGENSDLEPSILYRKIYDKLYDLLDKSSIPMVVVTINKYQYQNSFVADREINTASAMVEIMANGKFL